MLFDGLFVRNEWVMPIECSDERNGLVNGNSDMPM